MQVDYTSHKQAEYTSVYNDKVRTKKAEEALAWNVLKPLLRRNAAASVCFGLACNVYAHTLLCGLGLGFRA